VQTEKDLKKNCHFVQQINAVEYNRSTNHSRIMRTILYRLVGL